MALTKSVLNQAPINEMEVLEIPPLVKDGNLGKYVFLYDYQADIYTPQAEKLMSSAPIGGSFKLPENSFFSLKFSKGDVVDVIGFKTTRNEKGVPFVDKTKPIINVPKYVKPLAIGDATKDEFSFSPTTIIDNSLGFLQKVADTTPVSTKFGVNFGKNINPKTLPVLDNPVTPSPVVTNGIENQKAGNFFEDNKNLLMLAGVLVLGYILLSDKSE